MLERPSWPTQTLQEGAASNEYLGQLRPQAWNSQMRQCLNSAPILDSCKQLILLSQEPGL